MDSVPENRAERALEDDSMTTAAQQNAMMLASLLGVGEAEAGERLRSSVLITTETGWKSKWAREVCELLGRTLEVGMEAFVRPPDLEVVIGDAEPRTASRPLFVDIDRWGLFVDEVATRRKSGEPHRLYQAAAACAVAAASLRFAINEPTLPEVRLPLRFEFADLGVPEGALDRGIDLGEAVLAGAGAVAHGFLHAARHVRLRGEISIVDPKTVKGGVLNRCLYLVADDIGADKAVALASRAQCDFPELRLRPVVEDFRHFVKTRPKPPETTFVTVDSRAARRSIQLEAPRRIVDASTTDVRAVVVHSNQLPTDQACLACIYRHVPEEHAREMSIAAGLGVDLETVRSGFIDEAAARHIVAMHPAIDPAAIIGTAFDSLFRQLCSEQALATPEGRQILAPFAFVSTWAGVLMAVEMLRLFSNERSSNYWSVDPWNLPIPRARTLKSKHDGCEFCSNPGVRDAIAALWA